METPTTLQSIDSILDAKVRDYKKLLDRKDELEEATKANNKAIEDATAEIVQMMIDNEKPSTIVDGFNYSLKQETMYSKKSEEELARLEAEEGIAFFDVLREQGMGDIIKETVNANTLKYMTEVLRIKGNVQYLTKADVQKIMEDRLER